jgi:hypothetical protein
VFNMSQFPQKFLTNLLVEFPEYKFLYCDHRNFDNQTLLSSATTEGNQNWNNIEKEIPRSSITI